MTDALAVVKSAYACFGRGDIPGLLQLLSPDVTWQFIGDRKSGYSRRVTGHDQVAGWFASVARVDGIQTFEPREFLAGADHVTAIGFERTRALPAGGIYETEWVHVWQLKNGRITRFLGIFDSEAAAAARP
ncbi:MAG: nuclear transport factor 2 family protein [Planctomycetia bacterium]|nr:nuclear transport factor 2 family protein [Planctomycetia bacterium]